MTKDLERKVREDFSKALRHLEYSSAKAATILKRPVFSDEDLEDLEAFASRFARASDLGVQQLLRVMVLGTDPAFRGGVIDVLNQAEKFGWIASARDWTRIRELRNITAHEYSETEIRLLYAEVLKQCGLVLDLRRWL